MGLSLITALELASNYPDNILITSAKKENGKYSGYCHLKKEGHIHKLMLDTSPSFDTDKQATDYLHEIAVWCQKEYIDK